MKPFLFILLFFAFPGLLSGQSGPAPDEFDEFDELPVLIRVQVEFIEVSHETITTLMAAPRISSDDSDLRKKLGELVKKKQARIIETMSCVERSGQKATSESIKEFIYPTEYEPARTPVKDSVTDGKTPPPSATNLTTGPTPTAFETRNLGSTLEIEATLGFDNRTIDLRFAPEIVYHVGDITWAEWKDEHGDASIRMPTMYTLRCNTAITLISGQPTMVTVLSPIDKDGNTDFSRKIMVFAKADILKVGLPVQSTPDTKTSATKLDPIRLDAVPGKPLPADTTVVWTAAFPAVWQEAASKLGLESIQLDPPNPLSKQLAKWTIDPESVLPKSALLLAGPATNDFADKANQELESLLGNEFPPLRIQNPHAYGFLLTCAVNEALAFKNPFTLARNSRLPFHTGSGNTVPVHFFGVPQDSETLYAGSIDVLKSDMDRGIYALSIKTKDPDQSVILSTGSIDTSIAEAIETVRTLRKDELVESFHAGDTLRIPVLHFKTMANYTSALEGSISVPDSTFPWEIYNARQYVLFDMDESGVVVKVRADLEVGALGPSDKGPAPRHFRFDRPFFLFIWRNNAAFPWFAAHIDGNAALSF